MGLVISDRGLVVSGEPFAYIDIAADLIGDWKTLEPDPGEPAETADAIMAAFSLTQLREHLVLHLTIDGVPDTDIDEVITDFDLGGWCFSIERSARSRVARMRASFRSEGPVGGP